jgi:pre-mRNA-processing factor 6
LNPNSGKIWAKSIEMEPSATKKSKSFEALKAVNDDSDLFVALAKIFWNENKPEKTRKWL